MVHRNDRSRRRLRIAGLIALVGVVTLRPSVSAATTVCSASAFSCPASGTCTITGTWNVGSDCVLDFGQQAVELRGTIQADALSGSFSILAGSLRLFGGKLKSLGNTYSSGGNITVEVSGDFTVTGTGPRIDTSGNGGGGDITVNAATVTIDGGVIAADGGQGGSCGDGGAIDIEAQGGPLVFSTIIHATTPGGDCESGDIFLLGGPVTIAGQIDAHGGGEGSDEAISIESTSGDLVVTSAAWLRADGMGQPAGVGTSGGGIELAADVGNVTVAATVSALGKSPGGAGGDFLVAASGNIEVDARVTLAGGGSGVGGVLDLDADGSISVSGDVDATGSTAAIDGIGGDIILNAGGDVLVTSTLDSSAWGGGTISVESTGLTTLNGSLISKSSQGPGSAIEVGSCSIVVSGTIDSSATSTGDTGTIDLFGGAISLGSTARVKALPCANGSCITFEAPSGGVSVNAGAVVSPAAVITDSQVPSGCS